MRICEYANMLDESVWKAIAITHTGCRLLYTHMSGLLLSYAVAIFHIEWCIRKP